MPEPLPCWAGMVNFGPALADDANGDEVGASVGPPDENPSAQAYVRAWGIKSGNC